MRCKFPADDSLVSTAKMDSTGPSVARRRLFLQLCANSIARQNLSSKNLFRKLVVIDDEFLSDKYFAFVIASGISPRALRTASAIFIIKLD